MDPYPNISASLSQSLSVSLSLNSTSSPQTKSAAKFFALSPSLSLPLSLSRSIALSQSLDLTLSLSVARSSLERFHRGPLASGWGSFFANLVSTGEPKPGQHVGPTNSGWPEGQNAGGDVACSPSLLFAAAVIILTLLFAYSAKNHHRDVLPLLPRQVSWPILNSLHGAVDLLPTFVGSASSPNDSLEWKGACFYQNTAWMEFHNKSGSEFGGGTLHIKDIAARVISLECNLEDTPVSKVMTGDLRSVRSDTLAFEALQKMLDGKFRHLPVLEKGELWFTWYKKVLT